MVNIVIQSPSGEETILPTAQAAEYLKPMPLSLIVSTALFIDNPYITENGDIVQPICACCLKVPDPEYHCCFEEGGCDGPDECRGLVEQAEWRDFGEGE